jgi:cobalt/nickel transport system permease protein
MVEEKFSKGNSSIHKLDPRVKIITFSLFSIVVATSYKFPVLFVSFLYPLSFIIISKVNLKEILKSLLIVNAFILFLWIFLPFTTKGVSWFNLGPFTVFKDGIQYATLITLKSNIIILSMITLIATSSVFSIVHALHHLHVPDKLIHLTFFTFRYIHVMYKEYKKLTNAMKLRGFNPGTNIHTYKSYAYLIGNLILRSFDRAEMVYKAMVCRGFRGTFPLLYHFKMEGKDRVFLALSLAYICFLAAFSWG